MNQGELAKLLDESEYTISVLLNKCELAKSEQDEIIRQIKEYAEATD
jgi:hypothetical protein